MKKEWIEVFQSVVEYTETLQTYLPGVIRHYRENNLQEAAEQIEDLTEGLMWLMEALTLTQQFGQVNQKELLQIYQNMLQALENEDYILMADLLEYELLPMSAIIQEHAHQELSMNSN